MARKKSSGARLTLWQQSENQEREVWISSPTPLHSDATSKCHLTLQSKALKRLVIVKDQYSHLVWSICIPCQHKNRKCKRIVKQIFKFPCWTMLCAFRCQKKASGLKSFICWVRNYLFSQKLCYFRGSRFSKCFILSTTLIYSQVSFTLSNYH